MKDKTFDDDFKYTVVMNERDGSYHFETYGEDWETVSKTDPKCIWTVVDVDGKLIVVSGIRFVNRFLYIITEEPVTYEDLNSEYLYE